ncbi:GNAT family protein [Mammaliicoccus sp. P-M57]|uniref:GNAT family N-acetyltransferase n=1 Tax=Mammaliicoccus sp. P-M57 TaxID=2898716 RepID=UPI001EFB0C4D|nr:GNAT family protein [Mammaliicoccus sp. P-M57]
MEKNINIRALYKEDEALILKWKENKNLRNLIGTIFPINELEHQKWFENKMLDKNGRIFIIEENYQNPIGLIGFNQIDWINRNAELFIFIGNKQYRGKGIGEQATNIILDFAKENLNLVMIYLKVFSFNDSAIKMYEKIGFNIDGKLRKSKYFKGNYYDTIYMSKILDEDII